MKLRPLDTDIQAALRYRKARADLIEGRRVHPEFLLNPYAFGGGGGGVTDPSFASTFALLHFEGANAAVVTNDSSNARLPVKFFGNAQLSTSSPLTGSSSLVLDGTGDYIQIAASPFWALTNNNFTIEIDMAVTSTPNAYDVIVGQMLSSTNLWKLDMGLGGNQIRFTASTVGTTVAEYQAASALTWTIGQKYKICVERNGTTLRIYRDGVPVTLTTVTAISTNNLATMPVTPVTIGNDTLNASRDIAAKFDEFRFSRIARYSGAYTPETGAFPENTYQDAFWTSYTKSLLHMDGAHGSTSWVDSKGIASWTPVNGAAQSNGWAPAFATTSGRFNSGSAQYLSGSPISNWNPVSTDFSWECIWRPDSASTDSMLFTTGAVTITGGVDVGMGIAHFGASIAGKVRAFIYNSVNQYAGESSAALVAGTAYRIGFERFNGVIALYIDGVKQATTGAVSTLACNYNAAWTARIGRYDSVTTRYANGYMSEMRWTQGASRWGGFDYIPETQAFPDS